MASPLPPRRRWLLEGAGAAFQHEVLTASTVTYDGSECINVVCAYLNSGPSMGARLAARPERSLASVRSCALAVSRGRRRYAIAWQRRASQAASKLDPTKDVEPSSQHLISYTSDSECSSPPLFGHRPRVSAFRRPFPPCCFLLFFYSGSSRGHGACRLPGTCAASSRAEPAVTLSY